MIHLLGTIGVSYFNTKISVGNKSIQAQYFEHKMDGTTFRCEIKFSDDAERLTPSMIRYICNRLQINPRLFGLHLG